jgi:DNA-binding NarL/FixJ family response regulator
MVTGERIRVMVVDDDPDVRTTLSAILATDPDVLVVGHGKDGRQVLASVADARVDVVLLDIRMPRLDGLATLEQLRRANAPVRVLMLTTFGDADYVRRALAAGADGFLLKSGHPADLIKAVHGTVAGEMWLAPGVARFVAEDTRTLAGGRHDAMRAATQLRTLTPRELEVARAVARGFSNAEVGLELHLSESTVKAYLSAALGRLGLRNRVELASLVWRADAADA